MYDVEVADALEGDALTKALLGRQLRVQQTTVGALARAVEAKLVVVAGDHPDSTGVIQFLLLHDVKTIVVGGSYAPDGIVLFAPRPLDVDNVADCVHRVLAGDDAPLSRVVLGQGLPRVGEEPQESRVVRNPAGPESSPQGLSPLPQAFGLRALPPPWPVSNSNEETHAAPSNDEGATLAPLSRPLVALLESAQRRLFPNDPVLEIRVPVAPDDAVALVPDEMLELAASALETFEDEEPEVLVFDDAERPLRELTPILRRQDALALVSERDDLSSSLSLSPPALSAAEEIVRTPLSQPPSSVADNKPNSTFPGELDELEEVVVGPSPSSVPLRPKTANLSSMRPEAGHEPTTAAARSAEQLRAIHALIEDGDYFSLLGVAPTATAGELVAALTHRRQTVLACALEKHALQELVPMRDEVLAGLEEAYEILRTDEVRTQYAQALGLLGSS